MVLVEVRGHLNVDFWDWTPYDARTRDSRFNSCHSSSAKIAFRACKIRSSIGASSGTGFGTALAPVSMLFVSIRTRR